MDIYMQYMHKINFFFHTYTLLQTSFQKHFITLLKTEARVKSKLKQKLFKTHKHKENNFENDEQVPKSP